MMVIKKYVVKVKPTKSDSERRLTCILGLPPTGLKCHALSKSDI